MRGWPISNGRRICVWLGVGADGHTASIFPGPDLEEALDGPETRRAVGADARSPARGGAGRPRDPQPRLQSCRRMHSCWLFPAARSARSWSAPCALVRSARTPIGRVLARAEGPIGIHWSAAMTLHPDNRERHSEDHRTRRALPRRLSRVDRARARLGGRSAATCPAETSRTASPLPATDKASIRDGKAMNIGIVTAYNDMLSAHQPYGRYPEQMKNCSRARSARPRRSPAACRRCATA